MSNQEKTDVRLKYACGLIHDNLNPKWKALLLEFMGVKKEVVGGVFEEIGGNVEGEGGVKKKVKVEKKKKAVKPSQGMKKLDKASKKGMKSISSFFGKKVDKKVE